MPVFIAHRGNMHGPEPDYENTSDYLRDAYSRGFGVECDLQIYNDVLYYGHDEPQETVDYEFLTKPYVFCHAKTIETMQLLVTSGFHCFWHESDQLTLTSRGFMWCHPGIYPDHKKAIWLDLMGYEMPALSENIFGVCGDDYKSVQWNSILNNE